MAFFARVSRSATRVVSTGRLTATSGRTFAAEAAEQAKATPLRIYGLAGRYAHATFDAANTSKSVDNVEADFKNIKKLIESNPELKGVLENPIIREDIRHAAVGNFLDDAKVNPLTKRVFELLVDNGRTDRAVDVMDAYMRLTSAHRNEVLATVTSAIPLAKEHSDRLSAALTKRFLKPYQKLVLVNKTDKTLVAGFRVQIGEKFMDMSLVTQIDQAVARMREAAKKIFDNRPIAPS